MSSEEGPMGKRQIVSQAFKAEVLRDRSPGKASRPYRCEDACVEGAIR